MIQTLSIQVSPKIAANEFLLKKTVAEQLPLSMNDIHEVRITKRSIDARSRNIKITLTLLVACGDDATIPHEPLRFEKVMFRFSLKSTLLVLGRPFFAALHLIELNLKPY